MAYAHKLQLAKYAGFNLIVGTENELVYCSNRDFREGEGRVEGGTCRRLEAGIYGLCNDVLETPWPKLVRAREGFASLVTRTEGAEDEEYFRLFADRSRASDEQLPSTGVPIEVERAFSSIFVLAPPELAFGTRSTTLIAIESDEPHAVRIRERSFLVDGQVQAETDGTV